ncbi:unnamed protein product, partial [Urochloa humidicola]
LEDGDAGVPRRLPVVKAQPQEPRDGPWLLESGWPRMQQA